MVQIFAMLVNKSQMILIHKLTFDNKTTVVEKVIKYKSCGEVSPVEQDTIEYVS